MLLVEKSAVLTFSVLIVLATNINYPVYHLYMGKKKEFSTRLLNKLYFNFGISGQIGSVTNLMLILKGLELIHIPYIEAARHFQVSLTVFSTLEISIAHNMKLYNDDLYLDLGDRVSTLHLIFSLISARYETSCY